MDTKRRLLPATLLLLCLLGLCFGAPAFGDSLAVKQSEANRLAAQVTALGNRTEIASEHYDEARVRYNSITDKVVAMQHKIAKLQTHQHYLQSHLDTRVSDMYRGGGQFDFLTVLLSVRSFEDFDQTMRVLTALNNQDASTVSQLKTAKADAQAAKATLLVAQNEARQQKVAMAANADAVRSELAQRKRLLASVDAEIRDLMARQIASQSIPQQASTMASLLRTRSVSEGGITLGGTAPTSKAGGAVYWAEKELGKPYVWAAAGPDTFDCSGLMLWAYEHVGINLNHYSGDQINEGKHVDKSDLQPGDLVFFGSPIHHVGMYVGGGCFIEAPYTGTDVRISELSSRGDFAGACRPSE